MHRPSRIGLFPRGVLLFLATAVGGCTAASTTSGDSPVVVVEGGVDAEPPLFATDAGSDAAVPVPRSDAGSAPGCPRGTLGCPCDGLGCAGALSCEAGRCMEAKTDVPVDPDPMVDLPTECDAMQTGACDALGRTCVVSDVGEASCDGCHAGLVSEGEACVSTEECGADRCEPDEYCDILGDAPSCAPRPCPLGQAQTPDGSCAVCTVASCEGVEGSTGRFWAFSSVPGDCLCETAPGFFHNLGGVGLPIACDADGDGWTRQEVRETQARGGEILRQNLRCAPASVVRVSLRDEYGVESHVWSCVDGLVQQVDPPDCELLPLRLLESKRNDVAGELARSRQSVDANRADPYGERDFRPEELNALTKACSTAASDYNDDGTADINEGQEVGAFGEQARLVSFSHFIELHTAHFEPPAPGEEYGRLVIRERSRCSAEDFLLDHDPGSDAFSALADETYWRTCYRRRDAAFDLAQQTPGMDFAQWTLAPDGELCPDRGSCPALAPPHADIDATAPGAETPFGHGACRLDGVPPADGRWRGMHHHSQFKCVALSDGSELRGPQRRPSEIEAIGSTINVCALGVCDVNDADCRDGLACRMVGGDELEVGQVGWEAVGYQGAYPSPTHGYVNGCVNEDVEWIELMCRPFLDALASSDDVAGFGEGGSFGKSTCDAWGLFPEDDDVACDPLVRPLPLFFAPDGGEACNGSVFAP